jgi:hypothetical protein
LERGVKVEVSVNFLGTKETATEIIYMYQVLTTITFL